MRYLLENNYLKIEVSTLGATLVRFIEKKSSKDIVLGFDNDEDYLRNHGANIGASIGRNANRIAKGQFVLNGRLYQLSINNNGNQLHGGGIDGFAFKNWRLSELKDDEIVLTYHSDDLEQGFPGNLDVEVSYRLVDNMLIYTYSGISDLDTIFNMTNHSYFNFGNGDILNHELYIASNLYSPVDDNSLTLDKVLTCQNTPFDFTKFTKLKNSIEQLECGLDNNYVFENLDDKLMASLRYDKLQLNVYSDLPDIHIYSAYYLDTDCGKYGKQYHKYDGICLECQYYPNGINYADKYLLPILKKGEKKSHHIKYEIINL